MNSDMDKVTAIFWAVISGIIFVLSIVSIFWNPCHILTAIISGTLCALFIRDYRKTKKL